MTGAMYAAIAGLKTHMQNLNVIGNNIANVNTYGYKASRAVFKTSLYTTLTGGSNGTVSMGGTNPSQIGYGATVSSVDVDMSSGNYAVTGKSTDMMLDGDGFFLVGSKEIALNFDGSIDDVNRLTALTLTRVGNFEFRADGYLAKEDGNCVYGFLCTGFVTESMLTQTINGQPNPEYNPKLVGMKAGDPIFSDQLVPIRYPRVETAYYASTGERLTKDEDIFEAVTPPTTPPTYTSTLKEGVTKGLAIAYPTTDYYVTDAATGELELRTDGKVLRDAGYNDTDKDSFLEMGAFRGISVDPNTGYVSAISDDTGETVIIGCIAVGRVTNPNGVTNLGDNYYKASEGSGRLSVSVIGGNAANMGISQVNQSLWTQRMIVDANGNEVPDETDTGEYSGLLIHSCSTHIISNGLEMSKTDLAQEIANMILTQRGYQANTRIVTVTDSMLEELVNMKR